VERDTPTCKSRDILSSWWRVFVLYWLPALAIIVAGALPLSIGWRTVVWIVALATMGMACIVNALRCGRVHCYLTRPLLPSDGSRRIVVRSRHSASRPERLEHARAHNPNRGHRSVVLPGDVFGEISERSFGIGVPKHLATNGSFLVHLAMRLRT
jgi:hypothetical protein